MNNRILVAAALALAALVSAAGFAQTPPPVGNSRGGANCDAAYVSGKTPYDAIVVGAGLAGLAAAKELKEKDAKVLILERNGEIGGRARSGTVNGTPIDYGGAWLHDAEGAAKNPLTPLVLGAGFPLTPTNFNDEYYREKPDDGYKAELGPKAPLQKASGLYEEALEKAAGAELEEFKLADEACQLYRKNEKPGQVCSELHIDASTPLCAGKWSPGPKAAKDFCDLANQQLRVTKDVAQDYMPTFEELKKALTPPTDREPTDEVLRRALRLSIANAGPLETAAQLDQSSAYDAAHFLAGNDNLVNRTMGAFVQQFGKDLPVCLNTTVTRIENKKDGVTVHAGNLTYHARTALVTVSVGVLKAGGIAFQPKLPGWKQDAIDHLTMGNMQKVVIPFDRDIFPAGQLPDSWVLYEENLDPADQRLQELPDNLIPDKTRVAMAFVMKPLNTNIAIGFFGGNWAKALEARCAAQHKEPVSCDDLAIDIAKTALSRIFGQGAVDGAIVKDQIHVTHWSLDETSFGAYSVPMPGFWNMREVLRRPVASGNGKGPLRLFFAGEGTARAEVNGSYPGAYETGLQAAREIEAELGKNASR